MKEKSKYHMAAKATLLQLTNILEHAFYMGVAVALCVGAFYGIHYIVDSASLFQLAVMSFLLLLFIMFIRNYVLININGFGLVRGRKKYPWLKNTGVKPQFKNVSVKHRSGKVDWDVSDDTVNWHTSANDPVVEYKRY